MFTVHATKKLLDRVKQPVMPPVSEPTTALGNWYATALFWRPQAALLVNERTLLPVLMPLAPAATLMARFPDSLRQMLEACGMARGFVDSEVAAMADGQYAKTASRSVLGIMNEFTRLAGFRRIHWGVTDLETLALELSETPCGPLYDRHITPDRELDALAAVWSEGRPGLSAFNGSRQRGR